MQIPTEAMQWIKEVELVARRMGSPRQANNRRRRTRKGPEPACVQTPLSTSGWHMQGGKDELTSCRGYRLVGVAIPPVRRKGGRAGLPKKAKWSPRGTGTTVLTYPCPTASCVSVAVRGRARVTGKAGENGQHSGEVGGSSAWTRPSAPECGDTLKALAGYQRPIQGGDRPRRRLRGRYRLGHRPVVLLRTETAQCTVRPT